MHRSLKRFDTTRAHGRDIISRLDRLNPEVSRPIPSTILPECCSGRLSLHDCQVEWQHFMSLNYLIPDDTPTRSLDVVDYPDNAHASTKPIKEGILERKKRVVKNWKEAYFVLSSAGFLHEYPDSTTPLSSPSTSLFLPNCVVTQVMNPEPGKDRHATFTISGRQSTASGSMRGTFGMQHSDVSRSYRARSYAEALEWWTEIAKASRTPKLTLRSSIAFSSVVLTARAQNNSCPNPRTEPTLPAFRLKTKVRLQPPYSVLVSPRKRTRRTLRSTPRRKFLRRPTETWPPERPLELLSELQLGLRLEPRSPPPRLPRLLGPCPRLRRSPPPPARFQSPRVNLQPSRLVPLRVRPTLPHLPRRFRLRALPSPPLRPRRARLPATARLCPERQLLMQDRALCA